MDTALNQHTCPACGFDLGFPPWEGESPSDEICPSCGIQFGYDDASGGDLNRRAEVYRLWREAWIDRGMPWTSKAPRPRDWDPGRQIRRFSTQR
jgi:hypothetical protein